MAYKLLLIISILDKLIHTNSGKACHFEPFGGSSVKRIDIFSYSFNGKPKI